MYLENLNKPWSILHYELLWKQLPQITDSKILDFGSGTGITANHLALNNDVIAIEPSDDMLIERKCENNYQQIIGNIEQLKQQIIDESKWEVYRCDDLGYEFSYPASISLYSKYGQPIVSIDSIV